MSGNDPYYKLGFVNYVFGGLLMLSSVTFIIIGRNLYAYLKQFSKQIAHEMKCKVVVNVIIVSITFFLRGFLITLDAATDVIYDMERDSLDNNDIRYPIFSLIRYFIVSVVPIYVQIYMFSFLLKNAKDSDRLSIDSSTSMNSLNTSVNNMDPLTFSSRYRTSV